MTTARDALTTTSIFRFRTLENNLNFLNQSKHVWNDMSSTNIKDINNHLSLKIIEHKKLR
jgi:hypothetical protein